MKKELKVVQKEVNKYESYSILDIRVNDLAKLMNENDKTLDEVQTPVPNIETYVVRAKELVGMDHKTVKDMENSMREIK